MHTSVADVRATLGRMMRADKEQLVRDLCGETFQDDHQLFRFLRVREDGMVGLCWMQSENEPVSSCTLDAAVTIILTQTPDHPLVQALLWKDA